MEESEGNRILKLRIFASACALVLAFVFGFVGLLYNGTGTSAFAAQTVKTYTIKEIKAAGIHLLVNRTHKLPSTYQAANLVLIRKQVPVRFSNLKLKYQPLLNLALLYKAAKKTGIHIYVYSGHRTLAEQTALFQKKVQYYRKNHTEKQAIALASKVVAPPNTSEHQTGLAVDVVSTQYRVRDSGFSNSKAGKWLAKNSWKYGYVLRYARAKTSITGIIFEPWHFRFVGKVQAKKMYDQKLCLEEYVAKNM